MKILWHGNGYWERREADKFRSLHRKELLAQERLNLKAELSRFWFHCNRLDMTPEQRLERLKEFAEVVIVRPVGSARRFKRTHFIHSRCRRSKVCFGCDRPAWVRHHIIQIQHGGSNSKENIVTLCKKCHAEIHPWLKPITKSKVLGGMLLVNNSPITVNNLPLEPETKAFPPPVTNCSQSCEQDIAVPFNELVRPGDGY